MVNKNLRLIGLSSYSPDSKKYPALDGILDSHHNKLPIRSDIEKILLMDKKSFDNWYSKRRKITTNLLEEYQLFVSIPNPTYSSEGSKYNMNARTHVGTHIEAFKEGLEYLEVIKSFRENAVDILREGVKERVLLPQSYSHAVIDFLRRNDYIELITEDQKHRVTNRGKKYAGLK
jgi:hypothetical protein